MSASFRLLLLAVVSLAACIRLYAAVETEEYPTKFTERGSVANTRHNLTQRERPPPSGPAGEIMDTYRNNYGEVCVYCHTPHGATTKIAAPLWNRTTKATVYATYDLLGSPTVTQQIAQPGAASLTCLTCHDGQTAVDSIINMPGSGRWNPGQADAQSEAFLESWINPSGYASAIHIGLSEDGCLVCHANNAGVVGAGAADFTAAALGTDLRNDHPVGIVFPLASGDFRQPGGVQGSTRYFDQDGNGRLSGPDIRLFDSGNGPSVECATCHDPHGVASGGPGSAFNPTFLRLANSGSTLCMTCHNK